ncbi:uncharacterized protein IWZ02DRAFT_460938 [Phyllosticta citriasiana]|uniref:uncharacterized protein n=1 Tax=Phyllosticta citriasiana TaxID=595635 RepID=UPI0030FDA38C
MVVVLLLTFTIVSGQRRDSASSSDADEAHSTRIICPSEGVDGQETAVVSKGEERATRADRQYTWTDGIPDDNPGERPPLLSAQ